jgi:hypothetical protein
MTDIKPTTPQDAYDLWKDKMLFGNAYMDSEGKRIDPSRIYPAADMVRVSVVTMPINRIHLAGH